MKKHAYLWLSFLALAMTLTSCQAIQGIFKAGFVSAIVVIVIIVIIILWLVGRSRR